MSVFASVLWVGGCLLLTCGVPAHKRRSHCITAGAAVLALAFRMDALTFP